MKRILVTGGNGFLGYYVVQELLKYNSTHVTILSNIQKATDKIYKRCSFIYADIRNKNDIFEKVNNFDSLYHLAGNIRTETTDILKLHYDINTKGTCNILKACKKNRIRRFIFISTSEVYGEKSKENISEIEKKETVNNYSKTKLLAEEYCKKYANHLKITVLRPSYIYGYGQYKKRLFPRIIEQALEYKKIKLKLNSGGNDFVYVKDAAKGIVLLGEREQQNSYEDFNISSGKSTAIKEVFDTVKELTGADYDKPELFTPGRKFSLNIEKAKKAGYIPKYNLKRGISDFIDLYNKAKSNKGK
jgi:UDP-glucose 4-epimerase